MNTKTIFDAYSQYQELSKRQNKSALKSIIHKYLVEEWGGKAPKGSKATHDEVITLINLIKTLPVTKLIGTMTILEQKFIDKVVSKENCRSYRSAYKDFLNWAEEAGYFTSNSVISQEELPSQVNIFNRNQRGGGKKFKKNYHGRRNKTAYALMSRNPKGEILYPNDYINETLKEEIASFARFRKNNHSVRQITADRDIEEFLRILGWIHRVKGVPLDKLSLSSVIWYQDINLFRNDNTRKVAVEFINNNVNLIKDYLDFCEVQPVTKVNILTSCISLAKFIFRNHVGVDEYDYYINENDLPIIKRLSQLIKPFSKLAKSTPASIPYENKSVTWEEVMNVLEILRLKADCMSRRYTSKCKSTSGKVGYCTSTKIRKKRSIADDLQDFLSLAFMSLIPTDRARTYYELEVGKTFEYGLYERGRFTSVNKMKDKTQARWYIHLRPEDYKTGNTYKEYWGLMPNVEFQDGKKLYNYIDRWINEERELEQKCTHNRFFRGTSSYKPLDSCGWRERIKSIFVQYCNVPVTPKELRKMYVTYLYNINADDAQRRGGAYAMHQSMKMQEGTYNSQSQLERLQPIYEFNEKMHQEFFGKNSEHED